MAGPHFSVVIPTYNRAADALAAARSVLAQTDSEWELIIVDDGSTDDTKARLAELKDSRIRLFWNEKNRGQHACRNQAIRAAQGEWITFLDSDDLYLPERLAALRRAAAGRPEAGFWFTNAYIHRDGRVMGLLFDRERPIPEGRLPGWYASGDLHLPYVTTTVAIRKELFDRIGYFRQDLRILEDTELYARMLVAGVEVGVLRDPLAVRSLHEAQITRDYRRDFEEALIAMRAGNPPPEEERRLTERIAREVSEYLWRAGDPEGARDVLKTGLGDRAPATWAWKKTKVPTPVLAIAKFARSAWLKLRYHPLCAPAEFRRVGQVVASLRA